MRATTKPTGTESGVNAGPSESTSTSDATRSGFSHAVRQATSPPSELPASTTRGSFNASITSMTKRA